MSNAGKPNQGDDGSDKPLEDAARSMVKAHQFVIALGFILLAVEWMATYLKASREWLATMSPFRSVVIPPNDTDELAAVIGAYCVLVACAAGLGALFCLREYIRAIGWHPRQWIGRVFDLVGKSYLERHYAGLLHLQFGMRMLLILSVLIAALTSLGHRDDPKVVDSIAWIKWCHIAQVYICAAFLVYSVIQHFLFDAKRLSRLQAESAEKRESAGDDERKLQEIEEKSDKQASAVFVRIAWLDIAVISLIWCLTMLPDREFYLAYMLPLMGVWLVVRKDESVRMIWAVLVMVMVRGVLVMSARIYGPELSAALGITKGDRIWLYAGSIPKFALLAAVAFLVVTLRHVHMVLKSRIALVKSALSKLSDSEGHAVFIKDVHRRFVFANEEFLQLVTPTLHRNAFLPEGENPHLVRVPLGKPVGLEDIVGHTEYELGIETDEFIGSDKAVLGLPDSPIPRNAERLHKPDRSSDHFEGAEHSFSDQEGATPRFWTIKHALRDESDRDMVRGLVGEVLHGEEFQNVASEFIRWMNEKTGTERISILSGTSPD